MQYRVGSFLDPKSDDLEFGNLEDAWEHATDLSLEDEYTPFAIWNEDDEVERLFIRSEEFFPRR